MAATRQDEHADPALDPAEDPDLLIKGEGEPQDEDQNEELVADKWECKEAQYRFDDEEDVMEDNTITYQTSAIRFAPENVTTMKVMAVRSQPTCHDLYFSPLHSLYYSIAIAPFLSVLPLLDIVPDF
jgi:hypothetical protein